MYAASHTSLLLSVYDSSVPPVSYKAISIEASQLLSPPSLLS
jgi:hypothetical protein